MLTLDIEGVLNIQIPQRIVDFIHTEPVVVYLGTRSSSFEPHVAFCYGARVGKDRDTLTFFLLEPGHEEQLADLDDNGQIAVAINYSPGHETYQFKGECITRRTSTEAEYALQKIWFDKLSSDLPPEFTPHLARLRFRPTLAIEMRIREAYDQTPGPGAGGPIVATKEGA